jgi:hypothetical protein
MGQILQNLINVLNETVFDHIVRVIYREILLFPYQSLAGPVILSEGADAI